jgi:hypothetical protein
MSRSNPTINQPNPATWWFEWNGETGALKYYDKERKDTIIVKAAGFTFLLLDQLASVRGWHEASESGITANEVRDTRIEPMHVKAFKGGSLAEGLYAAIRDRVAANGGHFVANCYIGFKEDKNSPLKLGCLQFKGAALNAWVEFSKAHRKEIWEQAVMITGTVEGKKGKVIFQTPTFKLIKAGLETDHTAKALDVELQEYLKGYFERTRITAVERAATENENGIAIEGQEAGFRSKPGSQKAPAGGELPTDQELGRPLAAAAPATVAGFALPEEDDVPF